MIGAEEPSSNEVVVADAGGGGVPTDFAELWGEAAAFAKTTAKAPQYVTADDGLIAETVGPWVPTKHKHVADYVHISGPARRKWGSSAFIDVFSGPGRALIRDTDRWIDGSAMVAYQAGRRSVAGFSSIEIADVDDRLREATRQRLTKIGAPVREAKGPAKDAIKEIVARLDPGGLHFALLDPHNLGTLSFSLFEELARLPQVDILVHVSIGDIQRNSYRYTSEDYRQFDEFSPGWRECVGTDMNIETMRAAIVNDWSDQVQKLGLPRARHCPLVTGTRSQRLYWLMLLSRHPLAHDLWSKITADAKSPTFAF